MKRALKSFIFITILLTATEARAQLDSSSAVLLRPSGKAPSKQTLDSTRYKIRAPESRRDFDDEKPGTVIPTPVPARVTSKAGASAGKAESKATATTEVTVPAASEPIPTPVPPETKPVETPAPVVESKPSEAHTPPPVTQQVRDLILGGTPEDISEAKNQIHPQDPRANLLEIQIAPAYFYNGSESTYSYRDYSSHGPGLGLGMNVWLTPFFGLQSRFFTSVSSSVRSGGTNMVPMDVQAFEGGIRFRKHFGYSRKAAHLNWGIDYHDEINKINNEATTLRGRKSAGLSVSLEAVMPTSVSYAHTFQVDIRPRLQHSEKGGAEGVKSGNKAETNALSLSVGGQWTLDRRNQVFWKSEYSVERNLFKGEASQPDPATGLTPDGVSVTNSLLMFSFGFRWGS